MNLNYHPAPGLSELVPGFYTVPQNPIAMAAYGVGYTPGIGEVLPGYFTVPQNPLKDFVSGKVKPLGQGDCGCGCGGGGKINGKGIGDLTSDFSKFSSDLSAGNYMAAVQDPIMSIPFWALLGGIVFVLPMVLSMAGGGGRHKR